MSGSDSKKSKKLQNQQMVLELSSFYPDVSLDFIISALCTTGGSRELAIPMISGEQQRIEQEKTFNKVQAIVTHDAVIASEKIVSSAQIPEKKKDNLKKIDRFEEGFEKQALTAPQKKKLDRVKETLSNYDNPRYDLYLIETLQNKYWNVDDAIDYLLENPIELPPEEEEKEIEEEEENEKFPPSPLPLSPDMQRIEEFASPSTSTPSPLPTVFAYNDYDPKNPKKSKKIEKKKEIEENEEEVEDEDVELVEDEDDMMNPDVFVMNQPNYGKEIIDNKGENILDKILLQNVEKPEINDFNGNFENNGNFLDASRFDWVKSAIKDSIVNNLKMNEKNEKNAKIAKNFENYKDAKLAALMQELEYFRQANYGWIYDPKGFNDIMEALPVGLLFQEELAEIDPKLKARIEKHDYQWQRPSENEKRQALMDYAQRFREMNKPKVVTSELDVLNQKKENKEKSLKVEYEVEKKNQNPEKIEEEKPIIQNFEDDEIIRKQAILAQKSNFNPEAYFTNYQETIKSAFQKDNLVVKSITSIVSEELKQKFIQFWKENEGFPVLAYFGAKKHEIDALVSQGFSFLNPELMQQETPGAPTEKGIFCSIQPSLNLLKCDYFDAEQVMLGCAVLLMKKFITTQKGTLLFVTKQHQILPCFLIKFENKPIN